MLKLVGSPDQCSKRWVWEQYDHLILGNTVRQPGGDAAVIRLGDGPKGLALCTDVTQRYCEADPVAGGRQAVAEAWRNLTATGALPRALTDNLNFGNPERPEIMGQLVGCIQGIGEAARALDFPIVSGNVSLYNETLGRGIPPTPAIGGVGVVADVTRTVGVGFCAQDEAIVLVGDTAGWLGQSIYLRDVCGRAEGAPPPVDLAAERRNGDAVRSLIAQGLISACHDLSDGGLALALAEMAMASGIGAVVAQADSDIPLLGWLFGEDQSRYLIACAESNLAAVVSHLRTQGVAAGRIGRTGGDALALPGAEAIPVADLRRAHEDWLPAYVAAGGVA